MPGMSDFSAGVYLDGVTGARQVMGTTPWARYLMLMTTAPTTDLNPFTGFTEVSGGSYARVQFAGTVTVNGSTTTSSPTLHVASVPAWIAAMGPSANGFGVNVYDVTTATYIGAISTCASAGTSITLQANALGAVGATDVLQFSAFPNASTSSGSEPAITPVSVSSVAQINFAQSSGSWGTITSWAVTDAASSTPTNSYHWDYTGSGKWSPFECTLASPGVFTVTDQSFSTGTFAAVQSKIGGTLPTTGGSFAGVLTVTNISSSTFSAGVNTTGTGDGLVRPVVEYTIGTSTTFYFPAAGLVITAA